MSYLRLAPAANQTFKTRNHLLFDEFSHLFVGSNIAPHSLTLLRQRFQPRIHLFRRTLFPCAEHRRDGRAASSRLIFSSFNFSINALTRSTIRSTVPRMPEKFSFVCALLLNFPHTSNPNALLISPTPLRFFPVATISFNFLAASANVCATSPSGSALIANFSVISNALVVTRFVFSIFAFAACDRRCSTNLSSAP